MTYTYRTETYYNVFPWHTNHFGSLHGGIYMSWLIDTAGILMSSVSQGNYLLASVDYLYLFKPARLGDILRVTAEAKASWKSSVEIEVTGCIKRGNTEELGAIGLMSYVAVDENGRPRPLTVKIEGDEGAEKRRVKRLERKKMVSEDTSELLPGMTFGRSYIRTIYPEHGFGNGILYAGKMYMMLDEALAIVAKMYSKGNTFTASAGSADFLVPVKIGDILEIQGAVEYTGNTSLDVGAKIFAINHFTGSRRLVSRTVFSFVSIDENGKPRPIQKLEPSSEYERRIMEERLKEREERISMGKSLQKRTCYDS
ncbi:MULTISPECIES: acyl-CoA thioesterase [Metallosphaera]|uniref:Thioesterase superfamily protein n=3 Tax=Metallosphaera TaxID=41980 RepID=A4YCM8_METS5|nr:MULTISPECIES: acyl-CoA thioesterase [Metallosphaera]ABP94180.1 thioesterase superfamily protein [Metallosphaera sedula DSM 5348]AIM26167.1 thioesterase superfamily protein [Metallosphaera sedula]AKV73197.1 acyl-CoA thioester hydrolase [Metallosphaera sedula]AKV75441.1 acyl-CoA thioester hydrolase [Metallosphaera sedula]AKV77687.1 acyl-CoA thioester hydrolase [Metallosphaera sedula]